VSNLKPEDVVGSLLEPVHVHVTGVLAALGPKALRTLEALFDGVAAVGGTVSFDVNHRPALWSAEDAAEPLRALAERASVVFVGLDEAQRLWGVADVNAVRDVLPTAQRLVVKDGPMAATCLTRSGAMAVPSLQVDVTEPVGAGDAFAAGYLAAMLCDRDERTALRWGHVLAARVLTSVADQVVPPAWDTLEHVAALSDTNWSAGDAVLT
jgi:2-dehydro-3-deoxygluconokinase